MANVNGALSRDKEVAMYELYAGVAMDSIRVPQQSFSRGCSTQALLKLMLVEKALL